MLIVVFYACMLF